jgi:hypothetical protein
VQHPFNKKENAFIVIMANAAANAAIGTEVLAVQRLFYNITPNAAASILYVSMSIGNYISLIFQQLVVFQPASRLRYRGAFQE